MMRTLFLLLVLGSTAYAQDCDSTLSVGAANIDLTVLAAQKEKWDAASYYSDVAFYAFLEAAYSYCEGDKAEFAHQQLVELRNVDGRVNCAYHSTQANVASIRSKLAFEKIGDPYQALRHAEESAFYIKEALKWCTFSSEKIDAITGAKETIIISIERIKDYIKEFKIEEYKIEETSVKFDIEFKLDGH